MLIKRLRKFIERKRRLHKSKATLREIENLESLCESTTLAKITNNALKLTNTDLVPLVDPIIELRSNTSGLITEWTDYGVETRFLGLAGVV